MPNRHGGFIWYELLTENNEAAQRFYSAVFGWQATKSEHSDIEYLVLHARDVETGESHDIGGLMQLTPQMRQGGARSVWLGYIGVDNVDQTVANILATGGNVQMPPTDIPNVGRIAMVTDPQGAPFYVMRGFSNENSLAFAADKPRIGHCAWNELISADTDAAKTFYFGEFGWSKDGDMDMGPLGLYEFIRHDGIIGAIMPKPEEMLASQWLYYFRCADVDKACSTITANGGQILNGPQAIPGGDFTLQGVDPQGAIFALVGSRNTETP